jgi:hypothetical protein
MVLNDFRRYVQNLRAYGYGSSMRDVPRELARLLEKHKAALAELDKDERLTELAKNELRTEARALLRAGLDQVRGDFERLKEDALSKLPAVDDPLATWEARDFELRAPRLWDRLRYQLEHGVDVVEVAQNAERDELRVLEQELPAYLRATVPDSARDQLFKAAAVTIRERRLAILPEDALTAIRKRESFQAGVGHVEGALNWAEYATTEGANVTVLPTFEGGTVAVGAA